MIEIMGIKYLTEKEASRRYGMSTSWFRNKRWDKKGPSYTKILGVGRVMYPVDLTDEWFRQNMIIEE